MKKRIAHFTGTQSRALPLVFGRRARSDAPYPLPLALAVLLVAVTGCTMLTYHGPNGESFTRSSLGASTSFSSLTVEADTNGLRRVELRGYTNDSAQALGAVTEAAVKAALQAK